MTEKKEKLKKWGIPAGAALALLLCIWGYRAFFGSTFHIQDTVYLYIDEDDTADSVKAKIKATARPGISAGFSILSAIGGYTVESGRYGVGPDDNMFGLFRRLKQGRQTPVKLTLPSVRTMDRLAAELGKVLMNDSAAWATAFHDSATCADYGADTATLPCLFLPNTYEVYWNLTPRQLLGRMKKESDAYWTPARRELAEAAGLTPEEVITLASIVDQETANDAEKPLIAGMYLNRYRQGMKLQADPTVKFALRQFGLRRIYHAQLLTDSPYNTYRYAGLPPGPICIPALSSIEAVLHFAPHDYLYMCAKEDFSGTHNFAATYEEHLRNARKYADALNDRGIK